MCWEQRRAAIPFTWVSFISPAFPQWRQFFCLLLCSISTQSILSSPSPLVWRCSLFFLLCLDSPVLQRPRLWIVQIPCVTQERWLLMCIVTHNSSKGVNCVFHGDLSLSRVLWLITVHSSEHAEFLAYYLPWLNFSAFLMQCLVAAWRPKKGFCKYQTTVRLFCCCGFCFREFWDFMLVLM